MRPPVSTISSTSGGSLTPEDFDQHGFRKNECAIIIGRLNFRNCYSSSLPSFVPEISPLCAVATSMQHFR